MLLGWTMVTLTILFTVAGQILVKWQIAKAGAPAASLKGIVVWVFQTAMNPWFLLVGVLVVLAGGAWFVAMSRLPLSHTYPMMGISFPLVAIASVALLGEHITPLHVVGTALVFAGVVVLGLAAR